MLQAGRAVFLASQEWVALFDPNSPLKSGQPHMYSDMGLETLRVSLLNSTLALTGSRGVRFGQLPPVDTVWGELLTPALGLFPSSRITIATVAPSLSFLGQTRSVLIGLADGSILKYNSNQRNGKNDEYRLYRPLLFTSQIDY